MQPIVRNEPLEHLEIVLTRPQLWRLYQDLESVIEAKGAGASHATVTLARNLKAIIEPDAANPFSPGPFGAGVEWTRESLGMAD